MANPGAGRPKGAPNKATHEARQAIAQFVDGNAHRLAEWLDAVAKGNPEHDIKPNPAKAFELYQSVVEYHVPKLGRMEVAGDPDAPLQVEENKSAFRELILALKLQRQAE